MTSGACASCGRDKYLKYRSSKGLICITCYRSAHRAVCIRCNRERPFSRRLELGPICATCYDKESGLNPPAFCSNCKRKAKLRRKAASGRICNNCYNRAHATTCAKCGRSKPIAARTAAGPICFNCRRQDPSRIAICSECNTETLNVAAIGKPPLCQLCYPRPVQACVDCSRELPIHKRLEGGGICASCYSARAGGLQPKRRRAPTSRRRRKCSACGNQRLAANYLASHPLCTECAG